MRTLFLLPFVLFSGVCLADDGNWVQVGSAGAFAKDNDIQMVRERVHITLTNEEMLVNATFWFKNHGAQRTVTMAFPDKTTQTQFAGAKLNQKTAIKEFKSWVDGKLTPISFQKNKVDDEYLVEHVWTKKVAFGPKQSRVVKVAYRANHGFAGNGYVIDRYVISSGATWRGAIREAEFVVDWSKATELSKPTLSFERMRDGKSFASQWKSIGPGMAVTVLKNVEPDFDLDLSMILGFWNFEINHKPVPINIGAEGTDGKVLIGPRTDLLVRKDKLPLFFRKLFEWLDQRTFALQGGKPIRIARGLVTKSIEGQGNEYFYLKDVVQALGGTYRYDPAHQMVKIELPRVANIGAQGATKPVARPRT